jgi:ubiquinone/menaquinone biosynthesis C-methylase UbiE
MNLFHRWYCNSKGWARALQGELMPAVLRNLDLGDDVLEIGPGPGMSTDWLRERVSRLTSIEIDHRLAESLKHRLAGTNVTVVEGDASEMPFPDASFSGAVCFTMLHHVPHALQDRLLAEAARVLRPGAAFAGMDSTPSLRWNLYHLFDDRNPVDPVTFADRLAKAGFGQPTVRHGARGGFSWRATRAG